jgi:hypothetical protein
MSVYLDITNVLNKKWLNSGAITDNTRYLEYIYTRRLNGDGVKVGDESTYSVLTEPYRVSDTGLWQPPISPSTDWLLFLNPRYYRFGVRFEL